MERVAVVTGAGRGIGLATATLLSSSGWKVYGLSRSGQGGANIINISADVTDESQVKYAFDLVLRREGRIDLLVNNAGFGISGAVEFTELSDAKAQFDVNFFGQLNCIKAALPTMRAQKSGRIINLSSVAAPVAIPFQAFYSASKAAVNSLTLALRSETAPFGIKVSAVMPGDVRTGFTAARRKSDAGDEVYGRAISSAVAVMEHDEQSGMPPEKVAAVICRAASSGKPRALYTVGAKYKAAALLAKLLPAGLVCSLTAKIYK